MPTSPVLRLAISFAIASSFQLSVLVHFAQTSFAQELKSRQSVDDKLGPLTKKEILDLFRASRGKLHIVDYDPVVTLDCKSLAFNKDLYVTLHSPQMVQPNEVNWAMFYDKTSSEKGMVELDFLNVANDATYLIVFRVSNNVKNQEFQISDYSAGIDQKFKTA